jgi:hypothetical protein
MNAKYNKLDGYRDTGGECRCSGAISSSVHRIKHGTAGWGGGRGAALSYDKMYVGRVQETRLICRLPVETFVDAVN